MAQLMTLNASLLFCVQRLERCYRNCCAQKPLRRRIQRTSPSMIRLALSASVLAIAIGACASPTPYQPTYAEATSGIDGGYSEQRITPNRFRVTFSGNSMTSRDTVENYLLYRAAELTAQQGFDSFIMADRDVERDRRVYYDRPFHAGRYGYWGPRWRYRGSAFGWRSWDPWYGDPFWTDTVDVRAVDQYEASAEIIMRRGPARDDNPRAFNARQVLASLGPEIRRPA
jgi:hypothetical protein